MNRRNAIWMMAAVLVMLCVGATFAPAADDAPDDVKLLAGAWKPVAADLGGNKIDAMVLEMAKVVYEGDKYKITIGEKEESGSFTLDPKKSPKCMDIFPTSGDNNGKTLLAVYELDGERLTICYSLTPTVRPENFEPASNTLLLVKFERVKE